MHAPRLIVGGAWPYSHGPTRVGVWQLRAPKPIAAARPSTLNEGHAGGARAREVLAREAATAGVWLGGPAMSHRTLACFHFVVWAGTRIVGGR